MAVRTWDYGAPSTVWTTAANWSGDTVPIAADEVIFDSTSVVAPLTGMAIGDTGGINFDLLHFKSTYTGGIGATQVPLHTSAQKIVIEGTGTYYIEIAEVATGQDQVVPLVIVNNKDAIVYLTGEECDGSWVCEITNLLVLAGTVYIGNDGTAEKSLAVQNLYVAPIYGRKSNATVTIDNDCERLKATAYAMNIYMHDGTVISDSAAALIEMYDGAFTYGTEGGGGTTDQLITALRLLGGAFNWVPESTGGAPVITTAYLFGGSFDASSAVNDDVSKTITTLYLFKGASLDVENNMGNITITNLYSHGGVIISDSGVKIAISYNQP